jgi:hypothetical protein
MSPRDCLLFGAVVALLFACRVGDDPSDYSRRDDLTEPTIACEEAYARLDACCPDLRIGRFTQKDVAPCLDHEWKITTKASKDGCTSRDSVDKGDAEPLALAESHCILAMSCEELVARDVCSRAAADFASATAGGRPASRGICPW